MGLKVDFSIIPTYILRRVALTERATGLELNITYIFSEILKLIVARVACTHRGPVD